MTPGSSPLHCFRRRAFGRIRIQPILVLAATLAGCASTLPYQPERQPSGVTISAGIHVSEDRLRVEIDSEGYRVERAALVRDGETEIAPDTLEPPMAPYGGGLSIGLGTSSGGSWGSGGGFSVGTGIGIPIGGSRPRYTTLAVFRLAEAGPPPWRLRVKVVGVEAVDILLDPARSGRQ